MGMVKERAKHFSDSTSIHGIVHVANSSSWISCFFWSVICLTLFAVLVVVVTQNVTRFYSYPTSVNIDERSNGFAAPLITFCNHRHLSLKVLENILLVAVENLMKNSTCFTTYGPNKTSQKEKNEEFFLEILEFLSVTEKMVDLGNASSVVPSKYFNGRQVSYTQVDTQTIDDVSVNLAETLMTCLNGDLKCNRSYMSDFYHPFFYKCFTYDPVENGVDINEGIDNGITMIFFSGSNMIGAHDIPGFDNSIQHTGGTDGVRIVVHPRNTQPDPLNEGVDVPIGSSAVLGIKTEEINRLPYPYGDCTYEDTEYAKLVRTLITDKSKQDMTIEIKNKTSSYTMAMCKKSCYQLHIWKKCKCLDTKYPIPFHSPNSNLSCQYMGFNASVLEKCCVNKADPICLSYFIKAVTDGKCLSSAEVKSKYHECNCPPPCQERRYPILYSLSSWPAKGPQLFYAFKHVIKDAAIPYFQKIGAGSILNKIHNFSHAEEIMSNFVKVTLYFQTKLTTVTTDVKVHTPFDVISNTGGLMGLCMGVSVVSIFEILIFLCSMINQILFRREIPATRDVEAA